MILRREAHPFQDSFLHCLEAPPNGQPHATAVVSNISRKLLRCQFVERDARERVCGGVYVFCVLLLQIKVLIY